MNDGNTKKKTQRRNRPGTFRWIVLAMILVFVGGLGLQVYIILTDKPNPTVDYASQLMELVESRQGEGANGWDAFLRALEGSQAVMDAMEPVGSARDDYANWVDFTWVNLGPFTPDEYPLEREAIARMREDHVFDLLEDAWAAPHRTRTLAPMTNLNTVIAMDTASPSRGLAKALIGEMRLAANEKRNDDLVSAFRNTLRIGSALTDQCSLLDGLIGISISHLAFRELGHLLPEQELNEDTLVSLLAALESFNFSNAATGIIEGEHLISLDLIQNAYTAHGRVPIDTAKMFYTMSLSPGLLHRDLIATEPPPAKRPYVEAVIFRTREEAERTLRDQAEMLCQYLTLDPTTRASRRLDRPSLKRAIPKRQIVIGDRPGAWLRAVHSSFQVDTERTAARLMLALEIHHRRHGSYPESLSALVPDVLSEIPIDSLNGQPFGYRAIDPQADAHSRDYILYSFGLDGEDNGGTPMLVPASDEENTEMLQRFDPLRNEFPEAGYDYVFNFPRQQTIETPRRSIVLGENN